MNGINLFLYNESESEFAQSCPTLCDPMDCSLPGSSVHGIFQARILERAAIFFSKNQRGGIWRASELVNSWRSRESGTWRGHQAPHPLPVTLLIFMLHLALGSSSIWLFPIENLL